MRLGVIGASGRMGRAVVRLAREAGIDVVCAVAATDVGRDIGELAGGGGMGVVVTDSIEGLAHSKCAVCIDFSAPSGTRGVADMAAHAGFAVVSGTTGLDDAARNAL